MNEYERQKRLKKVQYTGPETPKCSSKKRTLDAISYAKAVLVDAKEYEFASILRDLERKIEDTYNQTIINSPYKKLRK